MRDRLKSGLVPVLLLGGALVAFGCGGGDDGVCGNGAIEGGEDCDGSELGLATCVTEGFIGGLLGCNSDCTFDTSACTTGTGVCGDGILDGGEQCDGTNLNGHTCVTLGFGGGELGCSSLCRFDTSGCTAPPADCGNGKIDGYEQCDGSNFNGHTCKTHGFGGGELSCTSACRFDMSACTAPPPNCGNGEIDRGEQCDGANLNEKTCETLGFDGGTLGCTAACLFDTNACTAPPLPCGNGEIDRGEQCDGANLNDKTCADQGFVGGELGCTSTCQFDTSGCNNCGNGVIDDGEQCDGANLNDKTCADQGFVGGELGCTSTCQFDTSGCTNVEPDCGNGVIDDDEQCDGANLNDKTCADQGFVGGELGCTSTCQFDTSGCNNCGNDVIDDDEQCDGANLNEHTCTDFDFVGGELGCTSTCQFDTTGCTNC
ncbi:MAG TPA: hypothetical protein PK329_06805, partial [Myxococcota bacterium]|nr:hypothetical protein [Myxococcota bacterium]